MTKHLIVILVLLVTNTTFYSQRVEDTHFSVTTIDINQLSTERTFIGSEATTNNGYYFVEGFLSSDTHFSYFDGQEIHPIIEDGQAHLRICHAWKDGILLERKTGTTSYYYVDDATLSLTLLSSFPQGVDSRQAIINDKVIIVGKDNKLYSIDGTTNGTSVILDNFDQVNTIDGIGNVIDSILYFSTNDKVYQTDGTREGTSLLWEGENYFFFGFKKAGDRVVFRTNSSLVGCSLSGECEVLVEPSNRFTSAGLGFHNVGDFALFTLKDSETGKEIWKTDGTTAGTEIVVDLRPGSDSGVQSAISDDHFVHGNKLYFKGYDQQAQNVFQTRIWQTDGTAIGTLKATEFINSSSFHITWEIQKNIATNNDAERYFSTNSDVLKGHDVWGIGSEPDAAVQFLGRTPKLPDSNSDYFRGDDFVIFHTSNLNNGVRDKYVYALNGPSTPLIKIDSFTNVTSLLGLAGNKFVFAANKSAEPSAPANIYLMDNSLPGSTLITGTTFHGSHFILNGEFFFTNQDSIHGTSIWKTDGTIEGTGFVADINPGTDHSEIEYYFKGGGNLFMSTAGQLWSHNGTSDEAQVVYSPTDFPVLEAETKHYAALRNNRSSEIIISDGTPEGTYTFDQASNSPGQSIRSKTVGLNDNFFYTSSYIISEELSNLDLIRIDPANRTIDTIMTTHAINQGTNFLEIHASEDLIYCHLFNSSDANEDPTQYLTVSDGTNEGTEVNLEAPVSISSSFDQIFYPTDDLGVVIRINRGSTGKQLEFTDDGVVFNYVIDNRFGGGAREIVRLNNKLILFIRSEVIAISEYLTGNPTTTILLDEIFAKKLISIDTSEILFTVRNASNSNIFIHRTDGTYNNTVRLPGGTNFSGLGSSVLFGKQLFSTLNGRIIELSLTTGVITDFEFISSRFTGFSQFGSLHELNDRLYFLGRHNSLGNELSFLEFESGVITTIEATSDEQNLAKDPQIFPNPSSGNLTVLYEDQDLIEVEVYDLAGRQLFSTPFSRQANINLTSYPPGVYILKVNNLSKQLSSSYKIILQ